MNKHPDTPLYMTNLTDEGYDFWKVIDSSADDSVVGRAWRDGRLYKGDLCTIDGTFVHTTQQALLDGMYDQLKTSRDRAAAASREAHTSTSFEFGTLTLTRMPSRVHRAGIVGYVGTIEEGKDGRLYVGKLAEQPDHEFISPSQTDILAAMERTLDTGEVFETGYARAMQSYSTGALGQLEGWEAGAAAIHRGPIASQRRADGYRKVFDTRAGSCERQDDNDD